MLLTKVHISFLLSNSSSDLLCPLCKIGDYSMVHLFFNCIFARVVWRESFLPLNSQALGISSMIDWFIMILNPSKLLVIPLAEHHLFQIFATVTCDLVWFSWNKAHPDDSLPVAISLDRSVKKISLEHLQAWKSKSQPSV